MGETMANEGGVAAVERALTILDAFRESDQSLTLTEISKRVGFYKSTTLRLAESLEKFGYLRRLEDGAFRLGPKPLFLGSLYQRHFRLAEFVPRCCARSPPNSTKALRFLCARTRSGCACTGSNRPGRSAT